MIRTIYATVIKPTGEKESLELDPKTTTIEYLQQFHIDTIEYAWREAKNLCPKCGVNERANDWLYQCEDCWYKEKFN